MKNKILFLLLPFLIISCADVKSLKIEAKNGGDNGFNESSIYFNTFSKKYKMEFNPNYS